MPRRRPKRARAVPKKMVSTDRLERAITKLTKAELVEFITEIARTDSGIKRRVETRFELEVPACDLVEETGVAIPIGRGKVQRTFIGSADQTPCASPTSCAAQPINYSTLFGRILPSQQKSNSARARTRSDMLVESSTHGSIWGLRTAIIAQLAEILC